MEIRGVVQPISCFRLFVKISWKRFAKKVGDVNWDKEIKCFQQGSDTLDDKKNYWWWMI